MGFVDQLITFEGKGPYDKGEEVVSHKGKTINTVVHSESYEAFVEELLEIPSTTWTITKGYNHRPDAIADRFLDSPELFWVILVYNKITNPFEALTIGSKIKIPQYLPGEV